MKRIGTWVFSPFFPKILLFKARGFIVLLGCILCTVHTTAQQCPTMTSPLDGDINVPVDNLISWTPVEGIIGYLISLGTTPGGGEIINRRSSGLNNFYQPEVGLPENTTIYVTISLFLPDAPIKTCPLKIFTTVNVTEPPECTTLSSPLNLDTEVRVDTNIKWEYAPGATNYRISMGSLSNNYDIVDNLETGNQLFYKLPEELPLNQEIFVRIVPFNENGDAIGCSEDSFTTGEPTVSCVPANYPTISIPDKLSLCSDRLNATIVATDKAVGYRWYKINSDGIETILSESRSLEYNETGLYRLELFNTINEFGATIECPVSKNFEVIAATTPVIDEVITTRESSGLRIEIVVVEQGNYEYALDNNNYDFQDSPIFFNIRPGERTVFVRDKGGCGIAERQIEKELSVNDFPNFFTPNGDGTNDFWQFIMPPDSNETNIETIHVFDRYGNFIVQLDPKSIGWNGNFNGTPMPASDYWYRAITFNQKVVSGHFTLKR
ncbi:T9SS type B sorting domain-containing protein [Maribacter sp. CXY002]|uniref:T9SS type B sorting domain-containing protein n=1 Tax=Maribacter luteocoastalis TaxID=3407671 RepID=UPI003B67E93B